MYIIDFLVVKILTTLIKIITVGGADQFQSVDYESMFLLYPY